MITLMLKDLRQTFWPALLGLVFLLAPPLACLSFQLANRDSRPVWVDARMEWAVSCWIGAVLSLAASSSITGVAFAKERRERTAELLATLPLARWKVFFSKAVVALFVAAAPFMVGVVACAVCAPNNMLDELKRYMSQDGGSLWVIATGVAAWLVLFGGGWCLSSILRSEVLAAAMPIVVLIVGSMMIGVWTEPPSITARPSWRSQEERELPRFVFPLGAIGVVGVVIGSVVAMRRKSP